MSETKDVNLFLKIKLKAKVHLSQYKTLYKTILIIYNFGFYILRFFETCNKIYWCIVKRFRIGLAFYCDIDINEMPDSTNFRHPYGIFIRTGTKIGENCTILQNVTIGQKRFGDELEGPTIIGDDVFIGAGAIILGNVKIGSKSVIGAGAIVLKDVPPNTTVVGVWK